MWREAAHSNRGDLDIVRFLVERGATADVGAANNKVQQNAALGAVAWTWSTLSRTRAPQYHTMAGRRCTSPHWTAALGYRTFRSTMAPGRTWRTAGARRRSTLRRVLMEALHGPCGHSTWCRMIRESGALIVLSSDQGKDGRGRGRPVHSLPCEAIFLPDGSARTGRREEANSFLPSVFVPLF